MNSHNNKPVIFIQSSQRHRVAAQVSAYSMKHKTLSPYAFDTQILCLEDFPALARRIGQKLNRDGHTIRWSNTDSQAFVPLRFLVPQLMNYQGRALVVDPDVFAIGDVNELLNRNMQGKAILCRQVKPNLDSKKPNKRPFYVSSVMLLDCAKLKHWQWEKNIEELFQGTRKYHLWLSLRLEDENTIGTLDEAWNQYDTINEKTKLLHNTRRSTQPWMTGLPYDRHLGRNTSKYFGLLPKHWVNGLNSWIQGKGYLPFGKYLSHPDPAQEKHFFTLLGQALDDQFIFARIY